MHRPATFQDMILLAERADQAFMADRNGSLTGQQRSSNFGRNNFGRSGFGRGFGNGQRGNFHG